MAFTVGDKVVFPADTDIPNCAEIPKSQKGVISAVTASDTYSVEVFNGFIVHGVQETSLTLDTTELAHGRRYSIIKEIVDRLKLINKKNPMPQTCLSEQSGASLINYPMDIKLVSLRSETPISLQEDNMLPALLVQYGDGMRSYSTGAKGYSRIGEVTEYMTVIIRAVVQQVRDEETWKIVPLTLVIAQLHESIESAVGDGPNLGVPGVRAIMIPRWDVADCWGLDYEIIDFEVKIIHVFKRGEGV